MSSKIQNIRNVGEAIIGQTLRFLFLTSESACAVKLAQICVSAVEEIDDKFFFGSSLPLNFSKWAWIAGNPKSLDRWLQTYFDPPLDPQPECGANTLGIYDSNEIFGPYNTHGYLDTHLKAAFLGWASSAPLILKSPEEVSKARPESNDAMVRLWEPFITLLSPEKFVAAKTSEPLLAERPLSYAAPVNGRTRYIEFAKGEVQREWESQSRPPLLALGDEAVANGRVEMKKLGLPEGSWFVSLHVRDSGFKAGTWDAVERTDGYRNADIESYLPAVEAINERGGFVVRVGDSRMKPLSNSLGLIDYALDDRRSNELDIYLFSQCRFFVGTSSGPILTPSLFGVPVVGTAFAPIAARVHTTPSLTIHKHMRDIKNGRELAYTEIFDRGLAHGWTSEFYENNRVELLPNSPEELSQVVEEMLDILDGRCVYSPRDKALQAEIEALYFSESFYGFGGPLGVAYLRQMDRTIGL